MRTRLSRLGLALAVWLLPLAVVSACNVPVFRYALERWRPDAYEVIIFHQGPLTPELEQLTARLREANADRKHPANVEVETVNVGGDLDKRMKKLLEAQGKVELPLMVVRYPQQAGVEKPLWTGKPSREIIQALVASPARREIAKRLLTGHSAVWLLVECGNKEKDDAAASLIQKEMAALQKTLKLPEDLDSDEAKTAKKGDKDLTLLSALPLEIKFSLVRLSRQDEAERLFLAMLLSAHDAAKAADEPIMYPIFGRGRALEMFVGKEISGDVMQDVARFLTGPCSCTVKQLNPGVDLLFAADWDSVLEDKTVVAEAPVKPGVPVTIPQPLPKPAPSAGPAAATTAALAAVEEAPVGRGSLTRYLWLAAALAGFTALLAVAAFLGSRNKSGESVS